MSAKEERRLVILNELEGGRLRVAEGAELLELSGRQARTAMAAPGDGRATGRDRSGPAARRGASFGVVRTA